MSNFSDDDNPPPPAAAAPTNTVSPDALFTGLVVTYDDIYEHCKPEAEKYDRCIANYQRPENCGPEREDLENCTKKFVAAVQRLGDDCSSDVKSFLDCKARNRHTIGACEAKLQQVLRCKRRLEKAMDREELN